MTFTKQQLEVLSEYEDRFYTSVYAKYARNLGSRVLDNIKKVYDEATGGNYNGNWSCGHCIYLFLREVGLRYFADKEEIQKQSELKEVKASVSKNNNTSRKKRATNKE